MTSSKSWQLFVLATLAVLLTAQSCPSGQYIASTGLCTACPSSCITCEGPTACTSCSANNFLVAAGGQTNCRPCQFVNFGCSVCLSNVACQTCQEGFVLENSRCVRCSQKISNCSSCSLTGATCFECRFPYILVNNTCISSTINAIIGGVQTVFVTINSTTTTQVNGTNVTTNTSVVVARVVLDDGTVAPATLSPDGCNQFQVFVGGVCLRRIYKCLIYEPNGFCRICDNGWLRTIYGDCQVQAYVMRCQTGFYLDAANDRCLPIPVGCDFYFPNNGTCFNCTTNYTLNNGTCVPIANCNSRQFFSNGVCVDVPLACLAFLSNGTCTNCAPGYTLSNGICTVSITSVRAFNDCVAPCRTCFYAQLNYCFSCNNGFALVGGEYGSCRPIVV